MVAGGMPISIAIPMAMGANIGTSLTSTIVSLGHIRDGEEFKRAFSAATVHDSFNLLAVAILLPVELLFRPLEKASAAVSSLFITGTSSQLASFNPVGDMLAPASDALGKSVSWLPGCFSLVLSPYWDYSCCFKTPHYPSIRSFKILTESDKHFSHTFSESLFSFA